MRKRQGRKARDAEYDARRRRDPALKQAQHIRSSARWRKVRRLKLSNDPLCEDCLEHGVTTAATQVHHIRGIASHPELAFSIENLCSLCSTCHAKREARERGG
jgi:5-methylcytosine-specific restriction protein A